MRPAPRKGLTSHDLRPEVRPDARLQNASSSREIRVIHDLVVRAVLLAIPLAGCSLLDWDDLTAGSGGAGSSASGSTSTGTSATTTGAVECVDDAASSAITLSLPDGVHCYRRIHQGTQWGLAGAACAQNYGGHLLTIEFIEEFQVHADLYPTTCTEESYACSSDPNDPVDSTCDIRAWTGGEFVDGQPTWTNGSRWTWADVWAVGEPNRMIDPIALRTTAEIDERPSDCPHAYLCEIDP